MRTFLLLSVLASTAACNIDDPSLALPERPGAFDVQSAEADAERYLGAGTQVLAVCGASAGSSLFLDELDKGFTEDGISEGVIIFVTRGDGRPEVLTRDISKQLFVASEDGGQIYRIGKGSSDGVGVWVVQYPSTGVVITHNLAADGEGSLVDLWTQNKPMVGPLPPRTSTFVSRCVTRT